MERWTEEAARGKQEVVRERPGKTNSWERDDSTCSQEEGKVRAHEKGGWESGKGSSHLTRGWWPNAQLSSQRLCHWGKVPGHLPSEGAYKCGPQKVVRAWGLLQADVGDIAGSIPDPGNKAHCNLFADEGYCLQFVKTQHL